MWAGETNVELFDLNAGFYEGVLTLEHDRK